MTTQTLIGSLAMLQYRIPDARVALGEAVAHLRGGEFLSAIGCIDHLDLYDMQVPTRECVNLVRNQVVALWGEQS